MSTSDRVQQALVRVEDRAHATANGTAQVDAAVLAEQVKRLRDERDAFSVELTEFDNALTRRLGSYGTAGRAANLAMVRTLRHFLDVVAAEVGVSGETLRCNPASARVLLDERLRDAFKDGQLHEAERMAPVFNDIAAQKDINHRRAERLEAERDAARKDAEELRLTLLAEQGNAEGAPEGWTYDRRYRAWRKAGGFQTRRIGASWAWQISKPVGSSHRGRAPTARAAMQAAALALFESRRSACIARALKLKTDGVILWPPNGAHQQTPEVMLDRLTDPNLTEAVLAVYEAML